MYKHFFKRLIDVVLSFTGIVVLAVPMIVIGVIIKLDSAGPVFFKQKRIAKGKKYFYIIKFRSMPMSAPCDIPKHELRTETFTLTKWQRLIRKTSIDELPQLFNILGGSMSIVGPRPALWNYYDLISERDKYGANDIKPGLTGWAQINGRDEIDVATKARLDGDYVNALNAGRFKGFVMDVKCFFGTIGSVLRFDGVIEGAADEPSMPQPKNNQD